MYMLPFHIIRVHKKKLRFSQDGGGGGGGGGAKSVIIVHSDVSFNF